MLGALEAMEVQGGSRGHGGAGGLKRPWRCRELRRPWRCWGAQEAMAVQGALKPMAV